MNHEYPETRADVTGRRHNGDRSPDEIEADLDHTRARMEADLAALQDRLSPGYLMDEALRYVRTGAVAEYFRNLGEAAKRNPMPLALVGTGLAWLAFSGRRDSGEAGTYASHAYSGSRQTDSEYSDYPGTYVPRTTDLFDEDEDVEVDVLVVGDPSASRISEREEALKGRSGSTSQRVKSSAEGMKEKAGDTLDRTRERASDTMASAKSKAHGIAESARHGVESARHGMQTAREQARLRAGQARMQARRARQSTSEFIHEQPMVAAGIALTVGAILGALLPSTRRERELMGSQSDEFKRSVKHEAESLAEEGQRRVKSAAESAAEAARRKLTETGSETSGETHLPQGESSGSAGPRSAQPQENLREGEERGGRLSGEDAKESTDKGSDAGRFPH